MRRSIALLILGVALGGITLGIHAQVIAAARIFNPPSTEASLTYSLVRANAGPGQCGCFFINGGSAEASFRGYRSFTTVVDVTGLYSGQIQNTGQPISLLMVTAGPRFNYRIHGDRFRRSRPFAQALLGVAYGFDSAFPSKAGYVQSTATSLALLAGLGLDIRFQRHITFRAIQADYGFTRLPNNAGNQQNLLRISSGFSFHLW